MPIDPETGKRKPGRPRKEEQQPKSAFGPIAGTEERQEMLERIAGADFTLHREARANYRYVWERDGKVYSLLVKAETTLPREITSFEVVGPSSVWLRSLYRGNVLIESNDPRLQKQIEPDPGPKVICEAADGTRVEMTPDEFLVLVNRNKARAHTTVTRN